MTEDELAQLEAAYDRALRRAYSEHSPTGIADAFDEADRLQRQILVATRRRRRRTPPQAEQRAKDVTS